MSGPNPAAVSIGAYFGDGRPAQAGAEVAVVIPSLLRPRIETALSSIYAQQGVGRVQVLIGADIVADPAPLHAFLEARPANVSVLVLTLPYSTSVRHGGLHQAPHDGGALRSILTFMANARHVAYLDDDNSWRADHLSRLRAAVEGKVWAHALRMLVDEETGAELGVDRWDSVGVDRGRFARQGGFVDPNCLMIDKVAAASVLGRWSEGGAMAMPDRNFFAAIRTLPHGRVEEPTVRYGVRSNNVMLEFKRRGMEF